MRVPYFTAKDKDSEQWVEGFYVEFPEHSNFNQECKLVHAIMVVTPDTGTMSMLGGLMGGNPGMQQVGGMKNTLNFCTIDISTLQQVGEVEIGETLFKPEGYIKSPKGSIILG